MRAAAYIVGPQDGAAAELWALARQLRFSSIFAFSGMTHAERQIGVTPTCFFLFAPVGDLGELRTVAEAVRFSPSSRLRFSPLIYFGENPSVDTLTRCIDMGFDDIIALPSSRERLRERLERQIGQPLTYYETSGYFGPDRRRLVTAPRRPAESRIGGQFRRIEIVRDLRNGTSVVRDENHTLPAA